MPYYGLGGTTQYYGPAQRKSPIHAQFTTNNAFITLADLVETVAVIAFLVHLIGVGAYLFCCGPCNAHFEQDRDRKFTVTVS